MVINLSDLLVLLNCRSGVILALIILTLLLPPTPVLAQDGGISLTARVGFDGVCKEGSWIPIWITVENQGPDLDGRLEVAVPGYGSTAATYAQTISLPRGSRKEVFLPVFPEAYLNELTVRLVSGQDEIGRVKAPLTCLGPLSLLYGVMAEEATVYNVLEELDAGDGQFPAGQAAVVHLDPGVLPDTAPALEALDALVFSNVDTGSFSENQRRALSGWVSSGGQLIVAGGPSWAGASAGMKDLLPVTPERTESLMGLELLSGLPGVSQGPAGETLVTVGKLTAGAEVLVEAGGLPLVVERSQGSGRVIFLTFDPALEPFRSWAGSAAFFRALLSAGPSAPSWAQGFQEWTYASEAVSIIPGLGLPPTGLLVAFLSIYVVAIGPGNYLLLRRIKRRELAWLTIPGLVLLSSVLIFLLGTRALGPRPVLNRLAVIQSWPGPGPARLDAVVGIFSPRRGIYELSVEPGFLPHILPAQPNLTRRSGWLFLQDGASGTTIPGLRLDVAGINAFALQGQVPALPIEPDLTLVLDESGGNLRGQIHNRSDLVLEDSVLLAPGGVQHLGDLKPGEGREVQFLLPAAGQAAPAGEQPALSGAFFAPGRPGGYPLVLDLLGASSPQEDPVTNLRFNLLNALSQAGYGGQVSSGGGFYLAAWSSSFPVDAALIGAEFTARDTTLILTALQPKREVRPGRIELHPSQFTWTVLEANPSGATGPYDIYLDRGGFSLQFRLAQPVPYESVEALTLHLRSYGATGSPNLDVSLWDFSEERWQPQRVEGWGDIPIPEPGRFVGPAGEVRLRLQVASAAISTSIEAADFTLFVNQP